MRRPPETFRILTLLIFVLAAAPAWSAIYESRAIVQVNPGLNRANAKPLDKKELERFVDRETSAIKADSTLNLVSQRLDLPERWRQKPAAVVIGLRRMITVQHVRGTDLLQIRVRDSSAKDARLICTEVVNSYQQRRMEEAKARAEEARKILAKEIRAQEEVVENAKKALEAALRSGNDVPAKKRDYATSNGLLQEMRKRQAQKLIPRSPVNVHELPSKPTKPVKP